MPPAQLTEQAYEGVPVTHPFYIFIEAVVHAGILSGYPPQQCSGGPLQPCFKPNDNVSRAQTTVSVMTAGNFPSYTPPQPTFKDVPASYWAYSQIESLNHLGIITGAPCSRGSNYLCFRPDDHILRGELSRVIFKAMQQLR
jgi:S-layer homology domain